MGCVAKSENFGPSKYTKSWLELSLKMKGLKDNSTNFRMRLTFLALVLTAGPNLIFSRKGNSTRRFLGKSIGRKKQQNWKGWTLFLIWPIFWSNVKSRVSPATNSGEHGKLLKVGIYSLAQRHMLRSSKLWTCLLGSENKPATISWTSTHGMLRVNFSNTKHWKSSCIFFPIPKNTNILFSSLILSEGQQKTFEKIFWWSLSILFMSCITSNNLDFLGFGLFGVEISSFLIFSFISSFLAALEIRSNTLICWLKFTVFCIISKNCSFFVHTLHSIQFWTRCRNNPQSEMWTKRYSLCHTTPSQEVSLVVVNWNCCLTMNSSLEVVWKATLFSN